MEEYYSKSLEGITQIVKVIAVSIPGLGSLTMSLFCSISNLILETVAIWMNKYLPILVFFHGN